MAASDAGKATAPAITSTGPMPASTAVVTERSTTVRPSRSASSLWVDAAKRLPRPAASTTATVASTPITMRRAHGAGADRIVVVPVVDASDTLRLRDGKFAFVLIIAIT